ncbi:hypothetical protein ElyMa_003239500 [Elysia marginata]|uniref:Uncharacterized protein n=1 Tax=Elysia marginata TaxID=1093978 RepID=A0AAV4J656_9GAST|nr:hypothetical protein ElyMa_003239500 [Elysia marginata]
MRMVKYVNNEYDRVGLQEGPLNPIFLDGEAAFVIMNLMQIELNADRSDDAYVVDDKNEEDEDDTDCGDDGFDDDGDVDDDDDDDNNDNNGSNIDLGDNIRYTLATFSAKFCFCLKHNSTMIGERHSSLHKFTESK